MYGFDFFKQRRKAIKRQTVRPVRKSLRRIVMHFHENAIHSARHARARKVFDKLRVSARRRSQSARSLQAVRYVVDNRITETAHDGKPSEIHHQIVVPKTRAALRYYHATVVF